MAIWIDIPEARPAYELFDGRLYQKMSPKRRHAYLQGEIGGVLRAWAKGRGGVGPEWRFRITDGAKRHALVPDVAYVAKERLRALPDDEAREEPPFAPDIAVEILSPDENRKLLALKIAAYLNTGARAVLVVDSIARTVNVHMHDGIRELAATDVWEHAEFPGLRLDFGAIFSVLDE